MEFDAPATGTFVAVYCYAGGEVCIEFEGVEGEPLVVPIGSLGAPYTYTFHILDPAGERLLEVDEDAGLEYDAWRVCMKDRLIGEPVLLHMPGVSCENLTDKVHGLTEKQIEGCVLPTVEMDDAPLTDGQIADLVERLCDTQECEPALVRTTSKEPIETVPAGGKYDLPTTRIAFVQANGDPGHLGPYSSEFDGTYLTPEVVIPRILVRTSDGATPVLYADVVSPSQLLPSSRIQFVDAAGDPVTTGPLVTGYASGTIRPGIEVPRRELTLNGVGTGLFVTFDRLVDGTIPDITTPTPSGIRYALSHTMWSGIEAIYQTGDEGTLHQSGFYDYVGPSLPVHVARLVDWFTLYDANIFGNTNRFTDRNGLQVYGDRIIMDHYTGLEWYSPSSALTGTWSAAITASIALNYGGNTDWRVPPLGVLQTIIRTVTGQLLNYAPFSIPAGTVWSSTTNVQSTTNAIPMISTGTFQSTAKSGSARYFFARRFAP